MGKDDYRHESGTSREMSGKRVRERSIDNHLSERSSRPSEFSNLCVKGISLRFDVEAVQRQLHDTFSPFGSLHIRIFKSSERRMAILYFRHSKDAYRAYKVIRHVHIHDKSYAVEISDGKEPLSRSDRRRDDSSPHRSHGSPKHPSYRPSPFDDRSRSPIRSSTRRPYYSSRSCRPDAADQEPLNDPKATRTLFVGSLEPDISEPEVRGAFERFGIIEQVDIKYPNTSHSYAFVRFANVDMAFQAKCKMSGNCIRSYHCKIGYGKPLISNMLYISGLGNWRDSEDLECFLNQFGTLVSLDWQYRQNYAVAVFETPAVAEEVCQQLKALSQRNPGCRLMVDFVGGDTPMEQLSIPRASSLIPLPGMPDLVSSLRSGGMAFPHNTSFLTNPFDFMRPQTGNMDQSNDEASRHRWPPRSMDNRQPRVIPVGGGGTQSRRPAPSQSRFGGRATSPIDSLLRPDLGELNDPVLSTIVTMPDLEAFLKPQLWSARLWTKRSLFRFRCLHVVGDEAMAKEVSQSPAFAATASPKGALNLQMLHQARTEASWMADAVEQIHSALVESSNGASPPFSILLTLSPNQEEVEEVPKDGSAFVERPLTCLVSYLRLKQRAGFLTPFDPKGEGRELNGCVPGAGKHTLVLLTPSSFSLSLLKFAAPRLSSSLAFVDDFLVLLVLRNS